MHRPGRRPRAAPRGARSVARPPRQRRTTGALVGRTTKQAVRRSGAVTTRAALLAVIVCALVLALAYPIRAYFAQRAEIRSLEAARAAAQRGVDDLERQRALWDDPAYVEAQARERLRYVRPGEKSLIVVGPAPSPAPGAAASQAAAAAAAEVPGTWYERVWSTVETAGEPVKPAAPAKR